MSGKRSHIISIGTAVPLYRFKQETIADFMIRYLNADDEIARKVSAIYRKSGIEYRHSVLHDFSANGKLPDLFLSHLSNPLLTPRLDIYSNEALTLSLRSIKDCFSSLPRSTRKKLPPITHLITVSCTGMSAPGLDIQLIKSLSLASDVQRTGVNFLGCYAGFHAFKMADSICASEEDAVVLVVMTELCSLHFQPQVNAENLVVNSLFADGSAAVLFVSQGKMKRLHQRSLGVVGFHGAVTAESEKYMTWNPSEHGFLMGLDALVPNVIEEHAGNLVREALEKFKIRLADIRYWALHPGGRKILEAAQQSIGLDKKDLKHSYRVLRDFGNMSSPTFCFVLKSLWHEEIRWEKKEKILAAGFGPGITMETALLHPAGE